MSANICRPGFDKGPKLSFILPVKASKRVFKPWQIAGHRLHEAGGGIPCAPRLRGSIVVAPGVFHKFSQRDRCATRLLSQPFPMTREQGHLTRHHAKFGTPGIAPWGLSSGAIMALPDVLRRAVKVKVHLFAAGILEDQYRGIWPGACGAVRG